MRPFSLGVWAGRPDSGLYDSEGAIKRGIRGLPHGAQLLPCVMPGEFTLNEVPWRQEEWNKSRMVSVSSDMQGGE
jgi:hypothetical protein